jgi:hypothetical protein
MARRFDARQDLVIDKAEALTGPVPTTVRIQTVECPAWFRHLFILEQC